jgi:molybdopterin molybdotransferase
VRKETIAPPVFGKETDMISPEEAWNLIVEHSRPLITIRHDLSDSLDHVLVNPVCADRDIPPADRAAMDGYAVRAADVGSAHSVLRVRGEVAAGSNAAPRVGPGECVRIFTGANLPPDTDTVIMVEDTKCVTGSSEQQERVEFLKPVKPGSHIFRKGENASGGDELIPAGTRLNAMHIGVCAAVGYGTLEVHRKPTVSVLATGEELLDVNAQVQTHQIRNSNGPMLISSLKMHGYEVVLNESVADDVELIAACLRTALGRSDVVVLTGGVSVGKYDFVPEAIVQAEGKIHFHRVAMKPGKPELFSTDVGGKCVFGLPGNPLSAMTGLHEFVMPLLRRLAGCPPSVCRPSWRVRLTEELASRGDRQRYVLGRLLPGKDGLAVEIVKSEGAADLVAGAKADGVIIVPPNSGKLGVGSLCEFRMWRASM